MVCTSRNGDTCREGYLQIFLGGSPVTFPVYLFKRKFRIALPRSKDTGVQRKNIA